MIEPARQRMKTGRPIRIDRARAKEQSGGAWSGRDPVARGRVQMLPAGDTPISQAQAAVAELKRLSALTPDWTWSACAVVARGWRYLDPVRSLCELEGIPVQMANEEFSGVWHLRETRVLVNWLRGCDSQLVKSADLNDWGGQTTRRTLGRTAAGSGGRIRAGDQRRGDTGESLRRMAAEWGREVRRRQRGLLLLTAHRAKGLEFDHVVVLDGGWDRPGEGEDADAPRRLYYVAMTRARQTLALARLPGPHPLLESLRGAPSALRRREPVNFPPPAPELARHYRRLSLRDVFLSFAGYRGPGHPVHRAIAALSPGDPLQVRVESDRWELLDRSERSWDSWPVVSGLPPLACAAPSPRSWPSLPGIASVRSRSTGTGSTAMPGKWWCRSWCSNRIVTGGEYAHMLVNPLYPAAVHDSEREEHSVSRLLRCLAPVARNAPSVHRTAQNRETPFDGHNGNGNSGTRGRLIWVHSS